MAEAILIQQVQQFIDQFLKDKDKKLLSIQNQYEQTSSQFYQIVEKQNFLFYQRYQNKIKQINKISESIIDDLKSIKFQLQGKSYLNQQNFHKLQKNIVKIKHEVQEGIFSLEENLRFTFNQTDEFLSNQLTFIQPTLSKKMSNPYIKSSLGGNSAMRKPSASTTSLLKHHQKSSSRTQKSALVFFKNILQNARDVNQETLILSQQGSSRVVSFNLAKKKKIQNKIIDEFRLPLNSAVFQDEGILYVSGGNQHQSKMTRIFSTAKWKTLLNNLHPRKSHSMTGSIGYLYMTGGNFIGEGDMTSVEIFNINKCINENHPSLITPRCYHASISLGDGYLFVFFGQQGKKDNSSVVKTIERSKQHNDFQEIKFDDSILYPELNIRACLYVEGNDQKKKIILFGGEKNRNTVILNSEGMFEKSVYHQETIPEGSNTRVSVYYKKCVYCTIYGSERVFCFNGGKWSEVKFAS